MDTAKRRVVVAYGQLPLDISKRNDISSDAKVLFSVLNAKNPASEIVAASLRELAADVPFGKSKVGKLLKQLVAVGLLAIRGTGSARLRVYEILHPNWQRSHAQKKCPRCNRPRVLGASGFCVECVNSLRLRLG